jgi:ubiquinone/menaquinone biosynthesis C-methylase UbiE
MNKLLSIVRYVFFISYNLLITRNQKFAYTILRIVLASDRIFFKFKFLKEYARKQHDALSLNDETRILRLTGKKILEVGSGMAYWGLTLKEHGRVIVAVEICDSYLRLSKMVNAYEAVIKGSASALPIRPNYFDTVLAIEVIEHLNKENGFLMIKEAERVSKCVVITTPMEFKSNENLPSWVPKSEHHLSFWTGQELQNAGLKTSFLGRSLLAVKNQIN